MKPDTRLAGIHEDTQCSQARKHHLPVFIVQLLFLCASNPVMAIDINTEKVEKDHELQTIRSQIKNVQSGIEEAKRRVERLVKQLNENELVATQISDSIQQYQQQISDKNKSLAALNTRRTGQLALLNKQRQQLSRQIRAAYKAGRNNYLKLLLNQEDPDQVGRMLAYYEYDTRARSKSIADINVALAEMAALEQDMQEQKRQLSQLEVQQQQKLDELKTYRSSRQAITTKLHAYIDEQGIQLQFLQKGERELAELVNTLDQQDLAIQIYEDMPPFNSLQGKLNWPVRGKITSRFGSLRKGGKLKWQGVTIAANNGVEVRAITTGKVIFADWFSNMGLLIILDHGDGFMSLYGHNERLLKKPGDLVIAGDPIAQVGDTGGQQQSGLYFEIRQSGNPINPNLWCRN